MMWCLYFGNSRERFASLKSPRMIKTESGCCCSVFVIRSASFCKAELTCACGVMWTLTKMNEQNGLQLMKSVYRSEQHIFFNIITSEHHLSLM